MEEQNHIGSLVYGGSTTAKNATRAGIVGASLANQTDTIKVSELSREGEKLSMNIDSLAGLLRSLEEKLDPVLRPEEKMDGVDTPNPTNETGLGKYLNEKQRLVSTMVYRVQNILARLEI